MRVIDIENLKLKIAGVEAISTSGAGRSYLIYTGKDKKELAILKDIMVNLGYRYIPKAYGTLAKHNWYIGYDNFKGRALAIAECLSIELRASGLECFAIAVED